MRITIETHETLSSEAADPPDLAASAPPGDDTADTAATDVGGPAADLAAEPPGEDDLEMGAPPDWLAEAMADAEGDGSGGGDGAASGPLLHTVGGSDVGGPPEF